jgi:Fe-S-cluster containining protein
MAKKKTSFKIVGVPEASWWEEAKTQPRVKVPENHAVNPCMHCDARCCKKTVLVTVVELLRMSFTLGIAPNWLVETIDADPKDKVKQPWPIKLEGGLKQLRLLHSGGHCAFAVFYGNGATIRCGIWSVRPGPCRIYPFAIELDDIYYRVGDESFCPVKWLQDKNTRKVVKADAIAYREDTARDKELVATWNKGKRDRSWDGFMHYVMHVMGPQLGHDPSRFDPLPDRPFFNH